ncbi:MgtC/SapB family protein [Fervidicella metallireducens]|uniref:MgtC/SapB family protein n=1 Tax=Fervidicella metallireducens TaxID=655338 RepID=UPI00068739D0|nr:MgtC/SapB family protein [Fervidicella metallireducens]
MDFDLLLQVALKLFMAFLLGGLVGYEREYHSRPAGLRTHILVCMGSALVQITALDFYLKNKGTFATDPMRLGAR